MRGELLRTFGFYWFITGLLASTTSCGPTNPYADALSVSINPTQNLLISPGPASNCTDFANYKVAREAGTVGVPVTLTQSVTGPVVVVNSFSLQWNSSDTLFVEDIRITVTGTGISGGKLIQDLNATEIQNLLATNLAIINPQVATAAPGSPPIANPVIIVSTDAAGRTPAAGSPTSLYYSVYAPCNFVFGGLQLTNGTKTSSFTANIMIQVIGTAEDQTGNNQRFVEYTLTAVAMYYGS